MNDDNKDFFTKNFNKIISEFKINRKNPNPYLEGDINNVLRYFDVNGSPEKEEVNNRFEKKFSDFLLSLQNDPVVEKDFLSKVQDKLVAIQEAIDMIHADIDDYRFSDESDSNDF